MTARNVLWLGVFLGVFTWSAIDPHDRVTWWLEVLPAVAALAVLAITRARFPLSSFLYALILTHAVILMVGGHYTYAHVPLGEWVQSFMGSNRNDYDKLGHLAQGFVPAIVARELFIRHDVLLKRAWMPFLVVCICLAISAFYELVEWWAALLSAEAAESFLGTQGYVWDTQSDMMWALVGALSALTLFSRAHDRSMEKLNG